MRKNSKYKIVSIYLVLTVTLNLFIINISATAHTSQRESAINVLHSSGWEQEEIDRIFTEKALLAYADTTLVATSEKYYRVIEDENIEISKQYCIQEVEKVKAEREQQLMSYVIDGTLLDKDEIKTSDGYLKYSVKVYKQNNVTGRYIVVGEYTWLIPPKNEKIDVFGVGHSSQLTQVGKSQDVYYTYSADIYLWTSHGKKLDEEYTTHTPTKIAVDDGGTVVSQQLKQSSSGEGYSYDVENHHGVIQYEVDINNAGTLSVSVFAEYLHQESAITISPSISFPAPGGSISVTPQQIFKRMSPNPYLQFIP